MDENGLPITGAGVNYASVEAMSQRELITYFNMFVVRTCSFLNTFSTKCESNLANLHSRLDIINTSLTLLETKLDSVDELKNIKLENAQSDSSQTQNNLIQSVDNTQTSASSAVPPLPPPIFSSTMSTNDSVQNQPPPPPPPPAPEPTGMTVSQDPRFKKYFSMVKVGVSEEAVRLKMRAEGYDPDLLSQPNAPAPPDDNIDEEEDDD